MSKFNNSTVRSRNGVGFIETTGNTATTFEGGTGVQRTPKSELFLAVVSDFGGENTFYETADARSTRIRNLVRQIAVTDLEWLKGLAGWLRNEANMRSISLTIALEGAKALNEAKLEGARPLVSSAIRRADEPGEALAYWFANFGRKLPSAVKRGISDAAVRSFNEYSLGKYDTPSHAFRFGDIIELTHPTPKDSKQSSLFKFAMDRRRDAKAEPSEDLPMVGLRNTILSLSQEDKRKLILSDNASEQLNAAGLTWEAVAGTFGKDGLDAKAYEALIPTMGYMALLRNLRNFEQKGVSARVLTEVANRIADPAEVAKSRQLPFRFLSAYRATSGSLRFGFPLEMALNHSLANVPSLSGNTLILVDRSGSMFGRPSEKTDLTFADSAAVFGSALALRAQNATLVQFGSGSSAVSFNKTTSVLRLVEKFGDLGGTDTRSAVSKNFVPGVHNRVIVLTDEQYFGGYGYYGSRNNGGAPLDLVPASIPAYTWNFVGYKAGSGESKPNRSYFGGLSDQSFQLIPLLEAGLDQKWPWEA